MAILAIFENGRVMSLLGKRDVARLEAGRFDAAKETLTRAFLDYNLMVYAAPDQAHRLCGVRALYGAILRDALLHGEVYATPDAEGVACWLPPGVPLPAFLRQVRVGLFGVMWAFGRASMRRLLPYDDYARVLHHRYAAEPHWFLATIGVDPAQQRQGIGGTLLEPVLAKADEQRRSCYLETHLEDNVRLYQRHGFQIAELCEVSGHPIPVWSMVRPSRLSKTQKE